MEPGGFADNFGGVDLRKRMFHEAFHCRLFEQHRETPGCLFGLYRGLYYLSI